MVDCVGAGGLVVVAVVLVVLGLVVAVGFVEVALDLVVVVGLVVVMLGLVVVKVLDDMGGEIVGVSVRVFVSQYSSNISSSFVTFG